MYLGDFLRLKENMEYGILAIIARFVNINEEVDYISFSVVGNQDEYLKLLWACGVQEEMV